MVIFNELKIVNNLLIVDVSVPNNQYYTDIYLDKIYIENQDTYGTSAAPLYEYTIDYTTQQKNYRLELALPYTVPEVVDGEVHNVEKISPFDLLFVYVKLDGQLDPTTPCRYDELTSMQAVADMRPFYVQAMSFMKELSHNCCDLPRHLIDFILRFKMLELCLKTGNYTKAIEFWNTFIRQKRELNQRGGCGCGHK